MSANSSFLEIQNNVLALISKSDATTRNRVKNWINMGYYDFVLREQWPFRETTGTITTSAGTQEYSLASNFSDIDENNITSVAIQGASARKLNYIPYNQLRVTQPDYDQEGQGLPEKYYIKGDNIGFWPQPGDTYSVSVDYHKLLTELSADSDEPIIPVGYREALVQYGLAKEHDYNTDPDLAIKAMNEYEQIITKARMNLLTQPNDMNNVRILGPADFYNHTDIGD